MYVCMHIYFLLEWSPEYALVFNWLSQGEQLLFMSEEKSKMENKGGEIELLGMMDVYKTPASWWRGWEIEMEVQ